MHLCDAHHHQRPITYAKPVFYLCRIWRRFWWFDLISIPNPNRSAYIAFSHSSNTSTKNWQSRCSRFWSIQFRFRQTMGMLFHTRYGYALVVILIVVFILYQTQRGPVETKDQFITFFAPNEENPQTTFVESDLVNLTSFRYTLKSEICNTVEDLLGERFKRVINKICNFNI